MSAAIPVAGISIALFRVLSRVGGRDATILENNIVQTAGSSGESLAFGLGVTMPGIMNPGVRTRPILVAVLGGLLGILMIALRRAALAYAYASRGRPGPAIAAAEKALANSPKAVKIRFAAARSLAEAGEVERAKAIAAGLAAELQAEPQAYAKIVDGVIALNGGDPRAAIKVLIEANGLRDTWIGHFDLGRAYFEAGQFPQADSELDRCLKRRGEALSLFLDEEVTFAYLPPVYYDSYRAYLAIRGRSSEDPLLAEAAGAAP